jgi:hypothetical protein
MKEKQTMEEENYVLDYLLKIWKFHGGDYDEFLLLWYKSQVCTSQETHYVSVTELIQLITYKIWCFHGGD